jgi:hypothetical protein
MSIQLFTFSVPYNSLKIFLKILGLFETGFTHSHEAWTFRCFGYCLLAVALFFEKTKEMGEQLVNLG